MSCFFKGELKSEIVFAETALKITLSSVLTAEIFLTNQKLNIVICDHDVIEKCVDSSGKVCVSCVRAVVRSVTDK